MKVYFDTNIVIDVLEQRQPFFKNSSAVFLLASDEKIDGIIGASSITDIYYIVNKSRKDSISAIKAIIDVLETLTLVDTTCQDINSATISSISDFEDAVTVSTASREGADYIVTRNISDFSTSSIPALTPEDFLKKV
jgi:predicted nucleic acid-binding protein